MSLRIADQFAKPLMAFNMTPIIDIVFLLIIFFMVVCQFIEAENFPVTVPDNCSFAATDPELQAGMTTVTVMKTDDGRVSFAVGAQKIHAADYHRIQEELARLINDSLEKLPPDRRVVILRIDKDISYSHAQYALAALAQSTATDIQIAAVKEKRPAPQLSE